jgi:serine/threonine protein kinase
MAIRTAAHPSQETLVAFNRGTLPAGELSEVESHVAHCDSCCAALANLSEDRLVGLARQAAAGLPATADSLRLPDVPPELVDHPRYHVLGQLGAGGMGVVYKAQHRVMDRVVALKLVSRRYTASPSAVERFRREVRAAAKLDHANIVRAYDAEEANGLHFLVMECVEGISLDRLVARRGPLPIATACQCVRQAAIGLQHAHERGMVHRDIKPHNLMVTREGKLKVLDFGLARLAAEAEPAAKADASSAPDTAVTTPSLVLGTPDYLAPEQAKNAHDVDIRADIYSLGCVLYFLLTGKPPFAEFGTGIEKMLAHVQDPPRPVRELRPEVPPDLAAVLDRMLAKDPAARYATPADGAAAVKPFTRAEALIDEQPDIVEPPPLPVAAAPTMAASGIDTDVAAWRSARVRKRPRQGSRRRWPLVVGGAAAGLAVLVVGIILVFGDRRTTNGRGGNSEPRRTHLLLVVPKQNVHWEDYGPVRDRFIKAGIEVTTASSAAGECQVKSQPPGGARVHATARVADINPADYSGVIFVGENTAEFTDDPGSESYRAVERLLSEMTRSQKVIGAMCLGQNVLLRFDVLRGRKVAGAGRIGKPAYFAAGAELAIGDRVWTDGRLVTASDPWGNVNLQFADAVLAALGK